MAAMAIKAIRGRSHHHDMPLVLPAVLVVLLAFAPPAAVLPALPELVLPVPPLTPPVVLLPPPVVPPVPPVPVPPVPPAPVPTDPVPPVPPCALATRGMANESIIARITVTTTPSFSLSRRLSRASGV